VSTKPVAAQSVLASLWPFAGERQTETRRYLTPAWHIDVTRDKFTKSLICRVYQGKRKHPLVTYSRSTLAFQFKTKFNTTQAAFRVGGGPILPWTSVYPELVASGATLSGKSIDNPTQGQVLIPVSLLSGAQGCDRDNGFVA
jgi:hypothetical protein